MVGPRCVEARAAGGGGRASGPWVYAQCERGRRCVEARLSTGGWRGRAGGSSIYTRVAGSPACSRHCWPLAFESGRELPIRTVGKVQPTYYQESRLHLVKLQPSQLAPCIRVWQAERPSLCFWMIFSHNHHLSIIAHASLHYCACEFESGRQSGHAVLSRSTARRSVRGSPVVAVRHSCHSWMRDEAAPADPTRPLFHCRGAGQ